MEQTVDRDITQSQSEYRIELRSYPLGRRWFNVTWLSGIALPLNFPRKSRSIYFGILNGAAGVFILASVWG